MVRSFARRWLGLGAAALLSLHCSNRPLRGLDSGGPAGSSGGTPEAGTTGSGGQGGALPDGGPADAGEIRRTVEFADDRNRKLDLLFVIGNAATMAPIQANLVRNLSTFINVLKGLPDGLPDLHMAVISSDMGAGDGSIPGCDGTGDGGAFQVAARQAQGLPACTNTTLKSGATFISTTGGSSPRSNFTAPDITSVIQCIAPLGSSGCGFQRPLAAVARALGADGAPPPPGNVGFLRPEAYLAIILMNAEDDCSAPTDSPLFNTDGTLASTLGPTTSYRCNEWGHQCGHPPTKPPRSSPDPSNPAASVVLDDCVPAEKDGLLTPVATYVNGIKALKANPASQIVVSSIQGLLTSYEVMWIRPRTGQDTGPWPSIQPSCVSSTGVAADPGVRLSAFAAGFGSNGTVFNACDGDYTTSLNGIAMKLSFLSTPACYDGSIRNKDASGATARPDCVVTDRVADAEGFLVDTVIPACRDNGSAVPCWDLSTPPIGVDCPAGTRYLMIDRGGVSPADGTRVRIDCAVCPDNDAACL